MTKLFNAMMNFSFLKPHTWAYHVNTQEGSLHTFQIKFIKMIILPNNQFVHACIWLASNIMKQSLELSGNKVLLWPRKIKDGRHKL